MTKGKTGSRRSHHGVTIPRLSTCGECGSYHIRHRMCENCGTYRKRVVVDVAARQARKRERAKQKARELGQEPEGEEEKKEADKPLDAKELSK